MWREFSDQALRLAGTVSTTWRTPGVLRGREGRALLYATGIAVPARKRLTLLINSGTASSAEAFGWRAAWHHRPKLVGTPSTGSGRATGGAAGPGPSPVLTTGRFLAPDGSPFGVHGLTPDRAYEG